MSLCDSQGRIPRRKDRKQFVPLRRIFPPLRCRIRALSGWFMNKVIRTWCTSAVNENGQGTVRRRSEWYSLERSDRWCPFLANLRSGRKLVSIESVAIKEKVLRATSSRLPVDFLCFFATRRRKTDQTGGLESCCSLLLQDGHSWPYAGNRPCTNYYLCIFLAIFTPFFRNATSSTNFCTACTLERCDIRNAIRMKFL